MALIKSLSETIELIEKINAGRESEAASTVGLNCDNGGSGNNSLLERIAEVAGSSDKDHKGGILVTPDTKNISNKELVSDALDLSYTLNESVSILVANSMATISTLSEKNDEDESELEDNEDLKGASELEDELNDDKEDMPEIDEEGVQNIKDTMSDGLGVMQDSLIDLFSTTAKLNIKAREMFNKAVSSGSPKEIYTSLVGNAITGAGILYAINKIANFSSDNKEAVAEAIDGRNVKTRADTIISSTLKLQENLVDLHIQMNKFNRNIISLFESVEMPDVSSGSLEDASEFISMAVEKIAKPISEDEGSLNSNELKSAFDKGFACIAALYDEYLQDFCDNK